MQKTATRVFIYASLAFGVFGILMLYTAPAVDGTGSDLHNVLMRCFQTSVFIILPSFALSVAGKYLGGKL